MTKPIKSFPKEQRAAVIRRRVNGSGRGIGYYAAVAAQHKESHKKS